MSYTVTVTRQHDDMRWWACTCGIMQPVTFPENIAHQWAAAHLMHYHKPKGHTDDTGTATQAQ